MSKRLAAASCIPYQTPKFVWISDELLTETFNRFCHHKRYGSNVPGSLEAQRRAAKKKATSLAHGSPGGISIDPSIVLGSSANKLAWWGGERDERAESGIRCFQSFNGGGPSLMTLAATPSRILPSWLFPFPGPSRNTEP